VLTFAARLRTHGPGQEPVLPTVWFRARCWFGAFCAAAAAAAAAAVAAADSTADVPTLRRFDGRFIVEHEVLDLPPSFECLGRCIAAKFDCTQSPPCVQADR